MEALIAALVSAMATLGTVAASFYTLRRMGRLGVGTAQQKLLETLTDLNSAYEDRIEQLEQDLSRLTEKHQEDMAALTAENKRLKEDLERRRRENLDLRQDMDDLRAEIRGLRKPKEAV